MDELAAAGGADSALVQPRGLVDGPRDAGGREAACDELAFAALGETDRSAYAATIVELAASLAPSAIAPG